MHDLGEHQLLCFVYAFATGNFLSPAIIDLWPTVKNTGHPKGLMTGKIRKVETSALF